MAEQTQQTPQVEYKPRKVNIFWIAFFVVLVIVAIYLFSRAKLNNQFWIIFGAVIFAVIILALIMSKNVKTKQLEVYEVIELVKIHNLNLPSPVYLDSSMAQVKPIPPNGYLVNFLREGIVYTVFDNFVTGLEFTTLHSRHKQMEGSVLYGDIVKSGKRKEFILQEASRLGVSVPEGEE